MSEDQNQNQFKKLFDEARYQLKYWEDKKHVTIRELADSLEKAGMPIDMITSEITRELEGYVSPRYIRECLDEKYKDKTKSRKIVLEVGCGNNAANIENNIPEDKYEDGHEDHPQEVMQQPPATDQVKTDTPVISYDENMRQLWHERSDNSTTNQINKLADSLITKTEHDKIVRELTETINKLADSKNKEYEKTELYKDQQLQISFQKERIAELEEIETKTVRDHGFTSAATMNTSPNRTTKIDFELGFPSNKLAKFFMDCRNCKNIMYLQHDGKNITSWRIGE